MNQRPLVITLVLLLILVNVSAAMASAASPTAFGATEPASLPPMAPQPAPACLGPDQARCQADLVFVVDTSQSMTQEIASLCSNITNIIDNLRRSGYDVEPYIVALGPNSNFPAGTFPCYDERWYAGHGSTVGSGTHPQSGYETWAEGVAHVANNWPIADRACSTRFILPISDELPYEGCNSRSPGTVTGTQGEACNGRAGSDWESISCAVSAANANDTLVFPIRAFSNGVSPNPPLACWRNIPKLMDDLAGHTGGQRFDLSDNAADLVAAIESVITANCGVQTQVTSVGECQVSPGLQEREVCFSFTGLVSDDDGIFTYDVAWGDGNSQSATTTSPYAACHIYTVPNDPGQTQDYTVAVGLTGQVGATSCPIENSKVISLNGCEPLAVTLASFDATPQADHVLVTWQTVSELDNAGFNLYRTVTSDPPTAANLLATIPSQGPGSTQGFFYAYQDYAVTAGEAYWYWLEDVDFNGATALHGPVSVVFAGPTAVTVSALEATPDQPVRSAWPLVLLMAAAALALAGAAGVRRTNA